MANRGPCIQGCHKDKKPPAGAERAYATFMLLEKPFDGKKPLSFSNCPNFLSSCSACWVILSSRPSDSVQDLRGTRSTCPRHKALDLTPIDPSQFPTSLVPPVTRRSRALSLLRLVFICWEINADRNARTGVQDLPDPCTYPKHLYGNLADPRAYPKHLDRDLPSTPIEDPKNAYFKVKEQGNPRPWPVPDKNGAPSKRKRDAHNYPFSPHHPSGHSMMYRWLDEPGRAGPYHATDSVVPTKRSSHVHNAIKKKV